MHNSFVFSGLTSPLLTKTFLAGLLLALAFVSAPALNAQTIPPVGDDVDQLEAEKTWQLKNDAQSLEAIESWLGANPKLLNATLENAVNAFNDANLAVDDDQFSHAVDRLDRVIAAISTARPDIAKIAIQLSGQSSSVLPPNFSHVLDNQNEDSFVRDHARLLVGRWLAQNRFYDEALEELNSLDIDAILAPESALFYRALAEHQLLRKLECKETIDTLLQHEDQLPVRFAVVAKMMQADLSPVEEGSLDEISRLMKDIYRRTQFQRSGTLVLKQEAKVIEKLDKLIEDIEQQQQQQQQQQSSSSSPGDGSQPGSKPMEESQAANGQGDGKATIKDLADGGQWGDMNPAERSAAMAEMVKDMPPHYRSAIEKYFRRLAQEDQQ